VHEIAGDEETFDAGNDQGDNDIGAGRATRTVTMVPTTSAAKTSM
jgi:hypothetical protein